MSAKYSISVLAVFVATGAVIGLALAGPPRADRRPVVDKAPRPEPQPVEQVVERLSEALSEQLSWIIDETDGTVTIAGVTRFEVDEHGRAVVEAELDGDWFDDPALSFRLPVVIAPDGQPAIRVLNAGLVAGNRVRLVLHLPSAADMGTVAAPGCAMYAGPDGSLTCCCTENCPSDEICGWEYTPLGQTCDCQGGASE